MGISINMEVGKQEKKQERYLLLVLSVYSGGRKFS